MPRRIDLTGNQYGRLLVVRLAKQRQRGSGACQWVCKCECGRTTIVCSRSLITGTSQSCGCLQKESVRKNLPTVAKLQKRYDGRRLARDEQGRLFLSLRASAKLMRVRERTIITWQSRCRWLNGMGIETDLFEDGLGQTVKYYLKDDLTRIIRARADRETVPAVADHTYVCDVARELSVQCQTVYSRLRQINVNTKNVDGKYDNGSIGPRSYIPNAVVEILRQMYASAIPAELILCDDAARELGLTRDTLKTRATAYGLTKRKVSVRCEDGKPRPKLAFLRTEIAGLKSQKMPRWASLPETASLSEVHQKLDTLHNKVDRANTLGETSIIVTKAEAAKLAGKMDESTAYVKDAVIATKKIPPGADPETAAYSFKLVGGSYEIRFNDEKGGFRKSVGATRLLTILSQPRRSLNVADIMGDPEGKIEYDSSLGNQTKIDEVGIRDILNRIRDIEELMAGGGTDGLENEKAELMSRLNDYARPFANELAKNHATIATSIRRFISTIENTMPLFASHLYENLAMDYPTFYYGHAASIFWIF